MNNFWISLSLTFTISLLLIIFGILRYKNIINPITIFIFNDICIITLLSAIVSFYSDYNEDNNLNLVLYISDIYILGFSIAFYPKIFNTPKRLFTKLVYGDDNKIYIYNYSLFNQLLLFIIAIIFFILLMYISGAGTLWLTDSRDAYQNYRAGSGFIFMATQWVFLFNLIYFIWSFKPRLILLTFGVLIYTFVSFFTGSKINIISGFVVASIYYNFYISRISVIYFINIFILGIILFLLILVIQGSYDNIFFGLSYFKDYTYTTNQFISRSDEFPLMWGYGLFSELWFYVPRVLYPDKPYEYGIILIHKVLYPGYAELGTTPGILPWSLGFLDFGLVGVIFSGFMTGFIRRGAYECFLFKKDSLSAFILMIQMSLIPVFSYASLPLIFLIAILFELFSRKSVRNIKNN